jgi:hypothetical protein
MLSFYTYIIGSPKMHVEIFTLAHGARKSISIVFSVSAIRHDSSLSKYRKQKQSPPLEILKMANVQGGDCFCLRYLLSDESWRITLTQKTMEMDFCVVFCGSGMHRVYSVWVDSMHARAPCARVKISTHIFGLPMLIYAMKVEMKVSVRYSQYRPPLSVINISIIK